MFYPYQDTHSRYFSDVSIHHIQLNTKTEFRGTIFDLLIILKLFLLKSDFEILKKDFKKQLNKLENELVNNPNALEKIKRSALKLPIGWENILNHI